MIERDRIVFEGAHAGSVPIAWNLAGGYHSPLEKVIDLHRNTLRECVRAYVQPAVSEAPSPKTNGLISKGVPHESHRTP